MTTRQKVEVGLAAAIGGVAPNMLRIAMCLTGDHRTDPGVNVGYVVGLVLLAGLGCVVALIWNERVPRRAFYLGMGLPAMLQIAISSTPPNNMPNLASQPAPAATQSLLSIFATSAYAQTTEARPAPVNELPQLSDSTIKIAFRNVPPDTRLIFMNRQGETIKQVWPEWTKSASAGSVLVPVPLGATEFEVVSAFTRNAPDEKLAINSRQPGEMKQFSLETQSDFLAGFLKALGRQAADSMKLIPVAPDAKTTTADPKD